MSSRNDKVSDVLAVLAIMRTGFNRATAYHNRNSTELRKDAVNDIAENELRAKRFLNLISAKNTIHDACARRLKPDVACISHFDELADQWLKKNSTTLKDILVKHSENSSQRAVVIDFFAGK
jgi:hypothetical protein